IRAKPTRRWTLGQIHLCIGEQTSVACPAMRLLAALPDQDQASRFGDYLLTLGIDNSVEQGASGWRVWVSDDDKMDAARRELDQFSANPNDPRYSSAGRSAQKVRT